jgi:methyl-accepting chemotaxis protein
MQNTIQPFINYANANMALISRFAQAPEIEDMARANIERYVELTQQLMADFARSDVLADLMRSSMENYSRFITEYTRSIYGSMMESQAFVTRRVEEASQRVEQGMAASSRAAEQMGEMADDTVSEMGRMNQQRRQAR